MPANKKKGAASKTSVDTTEPHMEMAVFASRLWTVTREGAVIIPNTVPPQGAEDNLGQFWNVEHCGDYGGPLANKVRACMFY